MWHEKRDQQHRAYWRKPGGGRDYEPFSTELEVRTFIGLCKRYGRAQVVARHGARASDASVTMVSAPASPVEHDTAVPALAAGLSAPVPAGISLAWLGEQYVSSGNKGNDNTRADYRRDLTRYVLPFFGGRADGDVDIAMVMTRPLPPPAAAHGRGRRSRRGSSGLPTSPATTGTASRSRAPGWPRRPGATSRACSPSFSTSRSPTTRSPCWAATRAPHSG